MGPLYKRCRRGGIAPEEGSKLLPGMASANVGCCKFQPYLIVLGRGMVPLLGCPVQELESSYHSEETLLLGMCIYIYTYTLVCTYSGNLNYLPQQQPSSVWGTMLQISAPAVGSLGAQLSIAREEGLLEVSADSEAGGAPKHELRSIFLVS